MPDVIDLFDRLVRRNPYVPRVAWLRNALRGPYHRLLKMQSRGLPLVIGGALPVRLPAEYCSKELETYEVESARAIAAWVDEHPGGLVVDIGCSFGYFTCGALFKSPACEVIAVDADLPSLAITRRVCSLAPDALERLRLYRVLIGAECNAGCDAAEILRQTGESLSDPNLSADPSDTSYVNLDTDAEKANLQQISLDSLLLPELQKESKACLIKCDVEGAEQIVLDAATQVLRTFKPTLLISVHPPYLPKFGGSPEAIRKLLGSHGYAIDIIGIDHEEHWLCN